MDTNEFELTDQMKRLSINLIPDHFKNNPLISIDYLRSTNQSTSELVPQITFHKCITALDLYKNKSLEELRYEDYLKNKKIGFKRTNQNSYDYGYSIIICTNNFKYKPTLGGDIEISRSKPKRNIFIDSKIINICAMLEYEKFSQEELRLSDYAKGVKLIGAFKHLIKNKPYAITSNTKIAKYISTMCYDTDVPSVGTINHICLMNEYKDFSQDELRLSDYTNGFKYRSINESSNSSKSLQNSETEETCCPICLEIISKVSLIDYFFNYKYVYFHFLI